MLYLPISEKSVVLFSGGLDSTVLLAYVIESLRYSTKPTMPEVIAVTVQYGSRHNAQELRAAQEVVKHYQDQGVPLLHEVFSLPPEICKGMGSTLMGEGEVWEPTLEELAEWAGPVDTVVPGRNLLLIGVGVARAQVHGAGLLFFGAHATDAYRRQFPDCTIDFFTPLGAAIRVAYDVRLSVPFLGYYKSDIARLGKALGAPLHLSWSCYKGGEEPCGKCQACVEREQALSQI